MMHIEFETFKRPVFGSDYHVSCTRRLDDHSRTVTMVLDTIGHHPIRHVRRFLRSVRADAARICADESHGNLEDMDQALTERILAHNEYIWRNNPMENSRPAGFCLATAVGFGNTLRCKWLGDCRVYHLRPDPTPGNPPAVTLLSTDHNRLYELVATEGTYTFLKNEMTEMSRSLTLYWGKPEQPLIENILTQQQQATIEMQPRDCVVLLTDGGFLPLVRSAMERSHFKLTKEQFRLEDILATFIDKEQFFQADAAADRWREIVPAIMRSIEKITNRKSRYKDDIAAVTLRAT